MVFRVFAVLFLAMSMIGNASATYVANDPINATDPTGMVIKLNMSPAEYIHYQEAEAYLYEGSPTHQRNYEIIKNSKETYTVDVNTKAGSHYNPNTRTISYNPNRTVVVNSSGEKQSSALGLAEEFVHAVGHDEMGTAGFGADGRLDARLVDYDDSGIASITSDEEDRALPIVNQIASELGGEATREHYTDVAIPEGSCGGVTSTKSC